MSAVSLVQFSMLDLGKVLPLGRAAFDRNIAESADNAGYEPPLHHMLCIASLKDMSVKTAADVAPYFNLFHAGFLVAADERDLAEIFEVASMPCITTESLERGWFVSFISGSLSQWRDAMLRGSQRKVSREVRHTYNQIYTEFRNIGLGNAFDFTATYCDRDNTFFLE